MRIDKAFLSGFRNLEKCDITLSPAMNIFYGNNAQGKTNFLEALYLCATGRSQRTRNDSQLIAFDKQESRIRLILQKDSREERIDVQLKRECKKGIAVNGISVRKLGELFGLLHTVIFSPEDLSLVKGGPSERRRFLDMEICQLSPVYYHDLQQYYRALKQRNNLLKAIQKKPSLEDTLFVWDSQLVQHAERLTASRRSFINKLGKLSAQKQMELTGGNDRLTIEYKPNAHEKELAEKLQRNVKRDIFMGATQSGPHKDDLLFLVNDSDVKIYGSQGQQRTTALAVKMAEIELIREETGDTPVLLLDDVLSELDSKRQKYLISCIKDMQVILTCAGIEDMVKEYIKQGFVFHVENGKINRVK